MSFLSEETGGVLLKQLLLCSNWQTSWLLVLVWNNGDTHWDQRPFIKARDKIYNRPQSGQTSPPQTTYITQWGPVFAWAVLAGSAAVAKALKWNQ